MLIDIVVDQEELGVDLDQLEERLQDCVGCEYIYGVSRDAQGRFVFATDTDDIVGAINTLETEVDNLK